MDDEKLSNELVWQADGHLTEIALTALGDGEAAILPEGAAAHAAACAGCSAALGRAALLSLRAGEAIREARALAPAAAKAPRPEAPAGRPLPVAAILAALAVAAIGAAPGLAGLASDPAESASRLLRAITVAFRAGRAVVAGGAPAWIAPLTWVSAAIFVSIGLAVARASGKRLSLGGGT